MQSFPTDHDANDSAEVPRAFTYDHEMVSSCDIFPNLANLEVRQLRFSHRATQVAF